MPRKTSTLFSAETALRPLTLCTVAGCAAVDAMLLWMAFSDMPRTAWASCAALCIPPIISNVCYLAQHRGRTTFGMIPVSLLGTLPATAAGCFAQGEVIRLGCKLLTAVLLLVATFFAWWFLRLWRATRRGERIEPDAALIVLGGAIRNGRPCLTLQLRLDVAAGLWHEAPSRTIVVSGGPTPQGSTTEADEMARYLREQGVDTGSIVLERCARNTQENIVRSCQLLDEREMCGQRCVISSDYHLYRALREAGRLEIQLLPVAAPTPHASLVQQWCREVLTVLADQ